MAQAVGHMCVVHNLRSLYDRIKPAPTYMILQAVDETPCHHFAEDLEARAKNGPANLDLAKTEPWWIGHLPLTRAYEEAGTVLYKTVFPAMVSYCEDSARYGGYDTYGGQVDLFMCTSKELIGKVPDDKVFSLPSEIHWGQEDENNSP
ncbi:hypothetical protein VHEMI05571 [[Torrubiella] hemipterigena]|uniref:Uncharacterized protein n=1 Tax=[Torrubiella] hemipterigena TaxID=1531966 RepID=A0A0A1SYC9_9HYPO|nr:hypothetical protein VHEMI05571 [[Torrubiella] hemipterigena]